MTNVLNEQQDHVCLITLNRVAIHNAFDNHLLTELQQLIDAAQKNSSIHVIVLKANGQHFSAGADLAWMQRMANFSEEENIADAMTLAKLMFSLHQSPKPTIAMVQGAAMGGGAGLVAACDIGIASNSARFCFSEVKLGLIPAVISPYVIKALGQRAATSLFISADVFDAKRALELQLIQHCIPEEELLSYTLAYAHRIAEWPQGAVMAAKSMVKHIGSMPISEEIQHITAKLIAQQRVSIEGQKGMQAFLKKDHHV